MFTVYNWCTQDFNVWKKLFKSINIKCTFFIHFPVIQKSPAKLEKFQLLKKYCSILLPFVLMKSIVNILSWRIYSVTIICQVIYTKNIFWSYLWQRFINISRTVFYIEMKICKGSNFLSETTIPRTFYVTVTAKVYVTDTVTWFFLLPFFKTSSVPFF